MSFCEAEGSRIAAVHMISNGCPSSLHLWYESSTNQSKISRISATAGYSNCSVLFQISLFLFLASSSLGEDWLSVLGQSIHTTIVTRNPPKNLQLTGFGTWPAVAGIIDNQ